MEKQESFKTLPEIILNNFLSLQKSLVDIIDNKLRRKSNISAKARIVKKDEPTTTAR